MQENPKFKEHPRNNVLFYTRILVLLALTSVITKSDDQESELSDSTQKPNMSYLDPAEYTDSKYEYLICEELPATEPEYPEKKELFEELVARIDKIMKFGVHYQLTEKIERINPKNICYVGDSYMIGITNERGGKVVRSNVQAKIGRPLIANREEWKDDDIKKHAIDALNNSDCRLLVLNGGLNDLYNDCDIIDEAETRVRRGYEEIFGLAWEKGIDIVVFDIPELPMRSKFRTEINTATERLNAFLAESGALQLVDTDKVANQFAKDKMHPTSKSYKELFHQIKKRIK